MQRDRRAFLQGAIAMAVADVVKKRADTLSHEVSPVYPTAKIGLLDAVKLSLFTGDRQVLNAWAGDMGCMVLPLAAAIQALMGAVRALHAAPADGADALPLRAVR